MYLSCPNYAIESSDGRLIMPWHICYSVMWELKQSGIKPYHENGIFGQFPDAVEDRTTDKDANAVMEQIWAGELGFVDHPEPGFVEETILKEI